MKRFSLKVKLIGTLTLIAVVVTILAYFGLSKVISNSVDGRIAHRSDDLAVAIGSAAADEDQFQGVATSIVRFGDVRSIAFAPADGSSAPVAISGDGTVAADPASTDAGMALQEYFVDNQSVDSLSGSTQIRAVVLGSPFEPRAMRSYFVAFDMDEGVIASDLEFGKFQALSLVVAALAVILLSAYLLSHFLVSRRLVGVMELDRETAGRLAHQASANGVRDEVLLIREHIAKLVTGSVESDVTQHGVEYILPETLPDIWLRIDDKLTVTDARIDSEDMSSNGETSIILHELSDLLSADVVDHVVGTMEIIQEGEDEAFEFSVGVKSYRALMCAKESGFTLEISESPADVHALAPATLETAEILAGLLEHLPVGVMDADARGVVRYANRSLFDARSSSELLGRPISEVVPSSVSGAATQAVQDARHSLEPQQFVVPPDEKNETAGLTVHVVPISAEDELSLFILVVQDPDRAQMADASDQIRTLEEQLWALELKVSDYEEQINDLSAERAASAVPQSFESDRTVELLNDVIDPMKELLVAAATPAGADTKSNSDRGADIWSAVLAVAGVLDDQLGTSFVDASQEHAPQTETRFHLATMLDEIAIAASERNRSAGSRISAFVQPSLPKWLFGNEHESRLAILQMIEFAQLVSGERPLILAAMQDASEGRSVRVRFEVQIPPPVLNDGDMAVLRGCITGEVSDDGLPSSLHGVLEESQSSSFEALDIELVKINNEATALRCSSNFEIAEEFDNDHSWVRGLRTLIIQGPDANDNEVQTALGAFGIIGYVVSDEETLVGALNIAEEYSNPYRFVLADVDTPRLESFVGQLFDGDAPVVLVGKKSESAMVGAISAGYSGYIAKPVRQVELLEVILSTVEPPDQGESSASHASAA